MKLLRRQFLQLSAGLIAQSTLPQIAKATPYPLRPVRIIVGFPPGGGVDIVARIFGQRLSEKSGEQFVIENRPGAGSNIGTDVVVRASADGYTLLLASTPNAINATLYRTLNFNFVHDIAPVVAIMRVPDVMTVHPSVPAKTVPEFITYAKANPGKLKMASAGIGSSAHLTGELFKSMTGIDLVHVPYRGTAPATIDLLAGQVQVAFFPMPGSIEFIRAGKLRALAVTTATRSDAIPDLPTIGEFITGYEASSWYGVGAPNGTPADIIEKLNLEINASLAEPKMKARLADLGGMALGGSPAEFGKLVVDETNKWAEVIRFANITPE